MGAVSAGSDAVQLIERVGSGTAVKLRGRNGPRGEGDRHSPSILKLLHSSIESCL
jgi:hypothetical protein